MKLSVIFIMIFTMLLMLSCAIMEHTPCEENCENNRRDCIELCGDPNMAGFRMQLGGNWKISSVDSCIQDCNRKSSECLKRCRAGVSVEDGSGK